MRPGQIARICHEANRAYCQTLGDNSQPAWEEAPDWQKESAVNGVCFYLDHPKLGPKDSHDNWADLKFNQGWKYGAVKDPEKKEHPCLVSFDELPEDQQLKDALFLSVVRALSSQEAVS